MEHHQTAERKGHLTAERLAAAIKAVTTRYTPEQVILFGSAARGTMTEESDIDLLLITTDHDNRNGIKRESLWLNGDELDVLTMSPEAAEEHRRTAATVQNEALSQGRTVHCKSGKKPLVPTGPSWMTSKDGMVKSSKLKPDESSWFIEQAEIHWETSNNPSVHKEIRCYHRHEAMEQCLKSLITAQGRRFDHTHNLGDLWTSAEAEGKTIPAARNGKLLERLAKYSEHGQYDEPDSDNDHKTLQDSEKTGEAIIRYTRDAIPRLSLETIKALAATPKLIKPSDEFMQGNRGSTDERARLSKHGIIRECGDRLGKEAAVRSRLGTAPHARGFTVRRRDTGSKTGPAKPGIDPLDRPRPR